DAGGDAGDDPDRCRDLPGRCAGRTLWDEVAGGGASEGVETDDEDGCVEVHDGGWCAQGTDDVRPGVQPGAYGDVRGGGASGCGARPGELHRRAEVAARGRGGGGDAGVGGQSVAPRQVRATVQEATPEAVRPDASAAGRIAQAVAGEGLGGMIWRYR